MRDPNRPVRLTPLNPRKRVRYTDKTEPYDGLENPGYTCEGRRPRVAGFDDIERPAQADRIEEMFSEVTGFSERSPYYDGDDD